MWCVVEHRGPPGVQACCKDNRLWQPISGRRTDCDRGRGSPPGSAQVVWTAKNDHRVQVAGHRSGRQAPAPAAASMQCRHRGLGPDLGADGPTRNVGAVSRVPYQACRSRAGVRSRANDPCTGSKLVSRSGVPTSPRPTEARCQGSQPRRSQSAISPDWAMVAMPRWAPPRAPPRGHVHSPTSAVKGLWPRSITVTSRRLGSMHPASDTRSVEIRHHVRVD